MPWDGEFPSFPGECGRGGESINAPVTIVEGGRGGPGGGLTVSVDQIIDQALRKFERQRQWSENSWDGQYPCPNPGPPGPFPPYGESMRFGVVNQNADTPLRAIGATPVDGMYLVTYGLVVKVPNAGAGVETLTINYVDPSTGSQTLTLTQSLAASGENQGGPTPIFLLGGSTVTVSVVQGGVYLTATYDAFVGLLRCG